MGEISPDPWLRKIKNFTFIFHRPETLFSYTMENLWELFSHIWELHVFVTDHYCVTEYIIIFIIVLYKDICIILTYCKTSVIVPSYLLRAVDERCSVKVHSTGKQLWQKLFKVPPPAKDLIPLWKKTLSKLFLCEFADIFRNFSKKITLYTLLLEF